MIGNIGNYKYAIFWLLFHIFLGFISSLNIYFLVFWFYLNLVYFFSRTFLFGKNREKLEQVYFLTYLSSFEIISRMSKASPIIPYEVTKYITFFIVIWLILRERPKPNLGLWIFILLLPALFYDLSGQVRFLDIVFNILGPLNLGLLVWYFSGIIVNKNDLRVILRLLVFPLITALVFSIIKTPEYEDLEFALGANFSTTAGFGSNQVATVFGVSFFFVLSSIYLNLRIFKPLFIEYILVFLFLFQGLVSFSRGGVIGGFIGFFVLFFLSFKNFKRNSSYTRAVRLVIAMLVLIVVITSVNSISDGNLLLRYQGETSATQMGTKDLDINTFTTNRFNIFSQDINLYLENPIMGVGAGASRYLRQNNEDYVAHIEFSRLLAEHGVFGVFVSILIIYLGIKLYSNARKKNGSPLLFAIFVVGVFSSFHAATRTFVTPLLLGLSTFSYKEN